MRVTLLRIVMEVSLQQPEKAKLSMRVTLLGIVMEVRPLQPEKAHCPMLVTLLGIAVFLHPRIKEFVAFSIIALQLSLE